ncbi:energy-coupling factor ABC transporter ATP-binding protein [Aquibacillus koreensis]|uniref:Energy-coupling factor ABC transporter ATP-binding protein n=1 Tax=Aquibacillus koreensis TaxID=279446 RepID=A0A9X3WMM9_9BACI|nr:energy-coupling factor ABC transporter ATP-binding protein [Aquibacillus koreensis]MCT2536572.1 energy-coupling factor ABC transporter ATP-binding protein [Aquibacillus koreensis]MDC3422480.1 energy-coupling factor ABC transporter ATP-binding protein [Aquibacillus koreensis]
MTTAFIEFKNVYFRYEEDQPWVLKNVSFRIQTNEWIAIIGHNGSGKSTIAKLINGLLFPQQGEIYVDGMLVNADTIWDVRKKVGMVFQNPDNQFVGTTVRDDVAFGLENRGVPREIMLTKIQDSLAKVGMEAYMFQEPHRLSGGQKQRVAIAGVMAISPDVMILDEATAMLDPHGRSEIMKTMHDIIEQDRLSLITITHDLHEIIQADRVIVMNQGEVWDEATPREIFKKTKDLQAIGLDLPFVVKLSEELSQLGITIDKQPLNHEELLEELWTYHLKM